MMFYRIAHEDGSVSWHTSRCVADLAARRGRRRGDSLPIEQVFIPPLRKQMLRALNRYASHSPTNPAAD